MGSFVGVGNLIGGFILVGVEAGNLNLEGVDTFIGVEAGARWFNVVDTGVFLLIIGVFRCKGVEIGGFKGVALFVNGVEIGALGFNGVNKGVLSLMGVARGGFILEGVEGTLCMELRLDNGFRLNGSSNGLRWMAFSNWSSMKISC